MATTKNINQLPLDMLTKIFIQYIEKPLPQQPIKILMQLRCVCKLWDHLIRSKSFIQDHLDHQKTSSNSNKYLLIDCGSSFIAHLIDSENSYNVLRSNVYNIHDVFDNACFLETYGVCDGVICLSCFSLFCIYLWNPIVRTVKKLPYGTGFPSHCQPAYTLCFGFHDNDYKVIKVVHSVDMYHIGIYSLNADSWKFSEFKTSNYFAQDKHHYDCTAKMRPYPRARLVNEAVYFIRYTSTSGRIVVFFDLSSEMIREINLPEDFQYSNAYGMEEYRDFLALVGYKKRYDNDVVMWVLKVSDNSFLWEKKITFKAGGNYLAGLITNDKLVMRMGSYVLSLCNIEDGFRYQLKTPKSTEKQVYNLFPTRIHHFIESLVLLAGTTKPPFLETQSCST